MNDLTADRAKATRRLLQPQEVEKFLGLTPENLRDQRRRGILGGIGQQYGGGRWQYSLDDVLVLAIAQLLFKEGIDLPSAIGVGKFAAPNVVECWSYGDRNTYPDPILVAFPGKGTINVARWTDPESVATMNAMVSYRIDIRQITERLSERVLKLVMASDINAEEGSDQ